MTAATDLSLRPAPPDGTVRARGVRLRPLDHSLAVAVVLPLLAIGERVTHGDVRFTAIVVAVGLVSVGVPHGQFDWPAARDRLKPVLGRCWLPVFLIGYLTLAAAVVAVWAASPLWGLLSFLILSGLHFGLEDLQAQVDAPGLPAWLIVGVRGALPLLVVASHKAEVSRLLSLLLDIAPSSVEPWVGATVSRLGPLWAVGFGALVFADLAACRVTAAAELVAAAVSLALLPPVLGFVLWFTLVHSVRHLLQVAAERRGSKGESAGLGRPLARGAAVSAAILAAGALMTVWLPWPMLFRAAVVGMAALTLPHLVACAWSGGVKLQR